MTAACYSQTALRDLERPADFRLAMDPAAAAETVRILMEAIAMLAGSPLVGPAQNIVERHLARLPGHFRPGSRASA